MQDQGPGRYGVLWEPASGSAVSWTANFSMVEGLRELFGVFVLRALIPFIRFCPHDRISFQRPHLQISSHWSWGFNIWILEGHTFSLWQCNIKNTTSNISVLLKLIPKKLHLHVFVYFLKYLLPGILLEIVSSWEDRRSVLFIVKALVPGIMPGTCCAVLSCSIMSDYLWPHGL